MDWDNFGAGKFYKEQTKVKKQDIYSNIDKMIKDPRDKGKN